MGVSVQVSSSFNVTSSVSWSDVDSENGTGREKERIGIRSDVHSAPAGAAAIGIVISFLPSDF